MQMRLSIHGAGHQTQKALEARRSRHQSIGQDRQTTWHRLQLGQDICKTSGKLMPRWSRPSTGYQTAKSWPKRSSRGSCKPRKGSNCKRFSCIIILHPWSQSKKKTKGGTFPGMLHTRDAQSHPLHRLDVVHERPKPKYPLRDLARSQEKRRSRLTRGTLASRLQQSQAGLFSLKRQGSMLILSMNKKWTGETGDEAPDKNKHSG